MPVTSYFLNLTIFVHSLVTLFYLNFVASTIAIVRFEGSEIELPFYTFDEMAEAALNGHLKVVNLQGTSSCIFPNFKLMLDVNQFKFLNFIHMNLSSNLKNN